MRTLLLKSAKNAALQKKLNELNALVDQIELIEPESLYQDIEEFEKNFYAQSAKKLETFFNRISNEIAKYNDLIDQNKIYLEKDNIDILNEVTSKIEATQQLIKTNENLFLKDLKVIRRKCFGNVFRKMDKHLETYTKEKTTELDNNIESIEKRINELSATVEKVKAISNQNNKAKISDLINTILDEYRSINTTMNTLYSIVDKLSKDCAKSLMPILDSN